MPIPPQFNGNIALWFSTTLSGLQDTNTELAFFRRVWSDLTAGQQAALKVRETTKINAAILELQAIVVEIGDI